MFLTQLNWLAIVVSFVVVFIAGWVWFGPKTFFPVWWRALGRDPQEQMPQMNMALVFGSTIVANFLQVVGLASVIYFVRQDTPDFSWWNGLLTGFLVGLVFAAMSSLSHRLFAGQGYKVWIIEVGSDVLNMTLAGLILGLWV